MYRQYTIMIVKFFAENKVITDNLRNRFVKNMKNRDDKFYELINKPDFVNAINDTPYYKGLDIITLSNIFLTAGYVWSRCLSDKKESIVKMIKKYYPRYYEKYNTNTSFDKYISYFENDDINEFIRLYAFYGFLRWAKDDINGPIETENKKTYEKINFLGEFFDKYQSPHNKSIEKEDKKIIKEVEDRIGKSFFTNYKEINKKFFFEQEPFLVFLNDLTREHGMLLSDIYEHKQGKREKDSVKSFTFYNGGYAAMAMGGNKDDKDFDFCLYMDNFSYVIIAYSKLLTMYDEARNFAKGILKENAIMVKSINEIGEKVEEKIAEITESKDKKINEQQEALNNAYREIERLRREKEELVNLSLSEGKKEEDTLEEVMPEEPERKMPIGEDITINLGAEKEFFRDEFKGFLLSALKNELKRISGNENSRRADAIKSIIEANISVFDPEKDAATLKNLLKKEKSIKGNIMNFKVIEGRKHKKLSYFDDKRYQVVMAKTASDYRANDNLAAQICNMIY